ncbi:MAG: hypothetical protein SGCHY_005263, partial [Lobulomycetales sp.]
MGKTAAKKRQRLQSKLKRSAPEISPQDLKVTLDTLSKVARNQRLLGTPEFAQLESVLKAFSQGPISRCTSLLATGSFAEALEHVVDCSEKVRLGTLMRWVSLIGDCSDASTRHRLLAAAIAKADPSQVSSCSDTAVAEVSDDLTRYIDFMIPEPLPVLETIAETPSNSLENLAFEQITTCDDNAPGEKQHIPVHIVSNPHDFEISWNQKVSSKTIVKHDLPFAADEAFTLSGVFSAGECAQLMQCGERIGYLDALSYGTAGRMAAQGCVWIVPSSLHAQLFARVEPHLPAEIKGRALTGLNRRFRFYRYTPQHCEYRAHVDGSWPPSGFHPENGDYKFDVSEGRQWSCLTFLIYLNDGFRGGSTSFFWPDPDGGLAARGIRPRAGCVAVFPHGDTTGALVHEGSRVTECEKVIIRTD